VRQGMGAAGHGCGRAWVRGAAGHGCGRAWVRQGMGAAGQNSMIAGQQKTESEEQSVH
jgi:hypothetical protein